MVISDENKFVTARAYPKMLLIQPAIKDDTITLTAPDMPDISLSFTQLKTMSKVNTAVWDMPIEAVDCGEAVAKWLSKFIVGQEMGMRLVFYPHDKPTRTFKAGNTKYDSLGPIDSVCHAHFLNLSLYVFNVSIHTL